MPRSTRSRKPKHRTTSRPKPKPTTAPTADAASSSADAGADDNGPVFFWKPHEVPYGIFSQWYEAPFTAPDPTGTGTVTYNTAEQFMMHQKALLFNDPAIAAEILETTDPRLQRSLGRAVKGFDEGAWVANRSRIVEEGSYYKFIGDPTVLLGTGERELVEASPRDAVWGIGRGAVRGALEDREGRRGGWGLNLLGKALVRARGRIRAEKEAAAGETGVEEAEKTEVVVGDGE
ncbi:uncharacterized protein H6S33_009380 [Morchella sextelata]|uniref:uncharacterized protein n=1 Tax=Morchella sextelata TaxID=1174677 RepID=UPI001D03D344|nr:uncharacterized protein H6S33_009380 [Morchella sextelata]KAH0613000.1 hypothetical protein H6S33_009380 [Morchella sextelata]